MSGFLVCKDKNVVIFYTDDLSCTPTSPIKGPSNQIWCSVQGLQPFMRWKGDESMHQIVFQVPAIVKAFNIFMNRINRFDQTWSTNPIVRKEKSVTMSIFDLILDALFHNGYAGQQDILMDKKKLHEFREFRRRVAEMLVLDLLGEKEAK